MKHYIVPVQLLKGYIFLYTYVAESRLLITMIKIRIARVIGRFIIRTNR